MIELEMRGFLTLLSFAILSANLEIESYIFWGYSLIRPDKIIAAHRSVKD